MRKLSALLPTIRWVPHDTDTTPAPTTPTITKSPTLTRKPPTTANPKENPKLKPKRSLLLHRKPPATATPDHGPLKRRKRTLSITSTSTGASSSAAIDARTHAQGQSMFFAMLPAEVREMVYAYVMGSETVHLVFAKKRFSHFVCGSGRKDGGEGGEKREKECTCTVLVGGARCGRLDRACLALLSVCRRIYIESTPHLYTPHTFSILHLTHLLYLPTRTPQPRLNTLRTLHLRWTLRALPYFRRHPAAKRPAYPEDTANWEKAWAILASLQGLRELRVKIVDASPDAFWEGRWLGVEESLLEAVKGVTRPTSFELVLPYEACRVDWDMGGCRVKLIRPVEGG